MATASMLRSSAMKYVVSVAWPGRAGGFLVDAWPEWVTLDFRDSGAMPSPLMAGRMMLDGRRWQALSTPEALTRPV